MILSSIRKFKFINRLMPIIIYVIYFLAALGLTVFFVPVIKKIAKRFSVIDYPIDERKIHEQPIPLLGGVAIFLTFFILLLVAWQFDLLTDKKINDSFIFGIIGAGLILMIGGFADDKFNLKPSRQIIFPAMATLLIILSGININFITNPAGGVLKVPIILGTILTFCWIMGMIYTTKFLDGLDGLATGICFIGSLIIFIVSLFWDEPSSGTSLLALIIAGSCLGFLIFNWHPAKIFLGEGGSVFLGFILAVLSIISGSKIAAALLVLGIPIIDLIWVLFLRFKEKRPLTQGDQNHLHFQLLKFGLSQRKTVIVLYSLASLFGIISLPLNTIGKIIALIVLFVLIFGLENFLYKRNKMGINGRFFNSRPPT